MTDFCSSLEHSDLPPFWKLQNEYFCAIKLILAMNQFQTLQNLHLWKNSEKNIYLTFFEKNDFIYWMNRSPINLGGRVFANGPGDLGSTPSRVIPKTLKMVLDTALLNTQQYKVRIEGKVVQSWERSSVQIIYCSTKYSYLIWLIFKQINLTHRSDPDKYYHSGSQWTWK